MTIIRDVFHEFLGMFLADARLTLATLALVTVVAGLARLYADPLVPGSVLLFGCLAILLVAVWYGSKNEARR